MGTKLSKYTQAQNVAAISTTSNDTNAPYTFQEWIARNIGVLPGREVVQYGNYVKLWYSSKADEDTTQEAIKEDYVNLLKQLTIAFKSEADELWATDIDFDDPDEIEQIIPFYANKLKEIAIYLINKRDAVQRAKLKYNMTGTYTALERIFHEYLLKAFTKRRFPGNEYITNVTDLSVLNTLPELSAVNTNFQMYIEELYDSASYFDRDPDLPVSSYFSFTSGATAYLDNLNIAPSDYEWLYNTGVSQLCADNPLLWVVDDVMNQYKSGLPLSAVELYDSTILNDYNRIKLTQKYIGEHQYILSGGYWSLWTDEIQYNIAAGNNWFYWPTGENTFENDTLTIDPIYLSATSILQDGGTAGVNITGSDVIFATRNNNITGAWLSQIDASTVNTSLSSRFIKNKNIFSFPYPGYGLSGEGLVWTGKSLNNIDQTFLYLESKYQQAVYDAYWDSSVSSISSVTPLYINDTSLIDCGARAGVKFDDADYVAVRDDFGVDADEFIYNGEQTYAWLYKMMKTDLPVMVSGNNMYWPFERYEDSFVTYASSNQCAPMALSSIPITDFSGSIAGTIPSLADHIYKKAAPNAESYTEGAWLSGSLIQNTLTNIDVVSSSYQPGIAMNVQGGSVGTFIWSDDNIRADEVISNIKHQDDCWYLQDEQFSLVRERPTHNKDLNYNQWQDCTCRSILRSPLGHPGETFDENDGLSDYIVAMSSPVSSFSFSDWVGIDGKPYKTSNDFGWFKLNGNYSVEPDAGWGSGEWVTNTGNAFMLSSNIMYLYYRHGMYRDDAAVNTPYIIINHRNDSSPVQWAKLIKDFNTGSWIDAGVPSDMILKPGDILYFSHEDTYNYTLTSSHYEYQTYERPATPDFSDVVMHSTVSPLNLPVSSTGIPVQVIDDTSTASNLVLSTYDTIPVSYYLTPTGTVTTSASFVMPGTTETTVTTTITTTIIDYYTYTNNAISYVINTNLYGWNYDTSKYDGISLGARPYWVEASDKDDDYTKRKGIDIWSGAPVLVDEYNFITQPKYSNLYFENGTYFEYNKRDNSDMIWKQPITINIKKDNSQWKKININTDGISNLSAVLYNNINDLVISATNETSDLILDIQQGEPLQINYYARDGFTWNQSISDSSLGLPPTGGVWTSFITGDLVEPDLPFAHLSNRHYPTYASAPSMSKLYSTKDSGGYFIPRLLGVSTAVSKNLTNELNTSRIDNDQSKRSLTAVYRNLDIYNTDIGLSNTDQSEPVSAVDVDSKWMKASITEGSKAGQIIQARPHQEFMPYQSRYETIGSNDNGLYRQGDDAYDPWFGDLDNTWENVIDWPANWRGQYDIKQWYAQQDKGDLQVYQWKTDIFSNQYAVLKDNFLNKSIYDKKHKIGGSIWTRDTRNIIQPASASLVGLISTTPVSLSGYDVESLMSNSSSVLDIDVWFDTLMVYTSSILLFYHIDFDYDTGVISSNSDEINYIITDNSKYGGSWFFEDDKKVTICTLLSCGDQIRPVLRSLNLETNQVSYLYNITSDHTDTSNLSLISYDNPVFTYNQNTKTYNIGYIGYSNTRSGMYFTTINIKDYGNSYDILSAETILPNA